MPFPHALDRDDPTDFCRHLYSEIAELFQDELISHAPRQLAAYRRALADLRRRHPELAKVPADHPLEKMDEEAHNWAGEAFWDGVAFGVAAADLRRALLGMHDVRVCRQCKGDGVDRALALRDPQAVPTDCGGCEGAGVVPVATPGLAAD